jgi:hypothetical protein
MTADIPQRRRNVETGTTPVKVRSRVTQATLSDIADFGLPDGAMRPYYLPLGSFLNTFFSRLALPISCHSPSTRVPWPW